MKTDQQLELIKSIIDNTYNRYGRQLLVSTDKVYDHGNTELGFCYKYHNPDNNVSTYRIVCSRVGDNFADFRVLMHEYGHIYLNHLDGIHEELDTAICKVLEENRDEYIDELNKSLNIDYAEDLINKVIDDPVLNHSLHNIAMDMEVNSSILSLEDVEEMEKRITAKLPKYDEEYLKWLQDKAPDQETKDKIQKQLDKMEKEVKIKLIHPSRYHTPDKEPFPDCLTYPEYLIMILKNLDQFVKMMVSINNGGSGDTSEVTDEQLSQALNGQGQGQGSGQGAREQQQAGSMDYSNGSGNSGGGIGNIDQLLEDMGMKDSQSGNDQNQQGQGQDQQGQGNSDFQNSPYKGIRKGGAADSLNGNDPNDDQPGGSHRDHRTEKRDEADRKRELGQISSQGGLGCGDSGGPDATRKVDTMADEVDMALDEVIRNYSSKIVDITTKKDMMYLWNRGINRSVIAPAYRRKYNLKTNPTITFLIDISGSMDTALVDRILKTISRGMKRLGRGLKYNIITWSTRLGEELKDLDARKPVPRISYGGGTEMAGGMRYFKEHYGKDSIFIIISDFEDYLEEWHKVEETMDGYDMYGFNYGPSPRVDFKWKNLKVRNFKTTKRSGYYW